ncbi:two-component system sensor histidine kinase CreC [Undibacterium macrobrachii]|jgi:two-component system sensor histidine kinase CreC|uniref:histidine kinase n=1 Tax=Undibacterium macrobrachii TaxID=1119058 RepID=A0ABQ2XB24_9BURK|nr:two-component system sensor histidine kinase CreC [Undibacterium macrobrachii]GGX07904.1 two-component sensor histidine kinase [Undibacterium macrobrachii]
MKIGLRILLSYFLILGLAAWFVLNVFVAEVRPGVRATLEDTLVDTAQLLAQLVAEDVKNGDIQHLALLQRMQNYADRSVDVEISGVRKASLDYRIYITDAKGIVIFDTEQKDVGKSYARWNDVYLTLRGQYGARSTRTDPNDENSSVMHVAAPILDNNQSGQARKIIGVLTVAKATSTIGPFIERSQQKILQRSFWILLASLMIGIGISWWLNRSLQKLRNYAQAVERDDKVSLPKLGNNEIGELGRALESMRHKLEGKQYVETLMHTLAHELKSPIAAIQGSAELLSEDPPEAERSKFLNNIIEQNQRQKQLIDKLLELIKVEKQQRLSQITNINIVDLLDQVLIDFSDAIARKNLRIQFDVQAQTQTIQGDPLLLRQAIGNLIDNAIAFSPNGAAIRLHQQVDDTHFTLFIDDQGSGIPDYAIDKIFDRFYSLPRADAAKSTGLGLPFVREVISLHGGEVRLQNLAEGGVRVEVRLGLG